MENINEFDKAWKITCPKCVTNPNNILWFKNKCNNCITLENNNKKYTEEDLRKTFMAGIECAVANGKNFEQYINSLNKQN
jgi:hypothetical protein